MQSSCSSHSVHKLSSHHSSALDMGSPVGSPLLLQPLLLPQGPRPPPCRPPVGLSHLGKLAQKTTGICSCRRCWQSATISRQNLGTLRFLFVASRPLARPSAATLRSARTSSRLCRSLLASCQAPTGKQPNNFVQHVKTSSSLGHLLCRSVVPDRVTPLWWRILTTFDPSRPPKCKKGIQKLAFISLFTVRDNV